MTTVLAFDTATVGCSAAVRRDGRVLARRFALMARGQSEALIPMVVAAMDEAGIGFGELDLIGVTVGPGAFTGLRIGLAAARAFGLAAGVPVAGVGTARAIAHGVPAAERAGRVVMVVIDAKRADVFVQRFDPDLSPLEAVAAMSPEQAAARVGADVLLAGCGAARVRVHLPDAAVSAAAVVPDAAVVCALAAADWRDGTALAPVPLYLRPPDVTMPGKR